MPLSQLHYKEVFEDTKEANCLEIIGQNNDIGLDIYVCYHFT
jgi:hypothetical protein